MTALAAGAALGVKDVASTAVKDAYNGLKALVKKRIAGRPDAELVLARYETAPDTWQAPLTAELEQADADQDTDLVTAAQALMSLVDEAGTRAGKYTVDVRGAQGVQVGDKNYQRNVINAPPSGYVPSGTSPGRNGPFGAVRLTRGVAELYRQRGGR